jgi:hypothetical protein
MPADIPGKFQQSPDFLPGMAAFLDQPAAGAKWSLGYASASLIPAGLFDPTTGDYSGPNDIFVGGGLVGNGQRLFIDRKTPTKLLDDQRVSVTALSDGSGRGTAVFASVDGYALTSYDVRIIRGLLREFAKAKNIVSINVGVLHQHSVIDILGMNGPLLGALFLNPLIRLLPQGWANLYSGRNPAFMKNLQDTTAQAIKDAVNGMEEGVLYYGDLDAARYVHDKRAPYMLDTKLRRFRFDPDKTGVPETWLVNFAAHAVGLGATTREVSGDYPYFMWEQAQKKYGVNFQMIQGGQLAITTDYREFGEGLDTGYERLAAYGRGMADLLSTIEDQPLAPLLNVRHAEYSMPVDNPLHMLLFRSGMIQSTGYQRRLLGPDMDLVTETAYMELGDNLAMAFGPGELDPILAYGGASTAEEAYTGKAFEFTPMRDMVRGQRELMIFGILNDHSGYYLVPNDIQNFVLFGNEEVNAASTQAAPALLAAFKEVTDWAKKSP